MRAALLSFCLWSVVVRADDTNAPLLGFYRTVTGWSPLQHYYVEQHTLTARTAREVWLVAARDPAQRRLLYSFSRSVTVTISDDEQWIAITDYADSDTAKLLLFHHEKGINYPRTAELTASAWAFASAKMGLKQPPNWDHQYVEVVRWTDDHTLLLCLHGDFGRHNFVDDWLCFYDVNARTFSTDLDLHNRHHTTLESER
jgi:hypothetical protein